MKNKQVKRECTTCHSKPFGMIFVENVKNPYCMDCGKKLLKSSQQLVEGTNFFDLPEKEKKELILKAAKEANKEQREMMEREEWEADLDNILSIPPIKKRRILFQVKELIYQLLEQQRLSLIEEIEGMRIINKELQNMAGTILHNKIIDDVLSKLKGEK